MARINEVTIEELINLHIELGIEVVINDGLITDICLEGEE